MSIGKNIQKYREEAGLTQKHLASILGISTPQLSIWENDKREPNAENLKKLSHALLVSIDMLLDNHLQFDDDEIVNLAVIAAYSEEERHFIKRFRALDSFGKHTVRAVIESEEYRMKELNNG